MFFFVTYIKGKIDKKSLNYYTTSQRPSLRIDSNKNIDMNFKIRFVPSFFGDGIKSETEFFDRQLFTLKTTIYLTFVFKAIFWGLGFLGPNNSPHIPTNLVTILASCIPAFIFFKINRVEWAKFFAYFPTIFIQTLSSYYVLLEHLPYGYAELALLPYVTACILFYDGPIVVFGVALNIVFYIGIKIVRFQLYHLSPDELFLDFTMSMLAYTSVIIITNLYKNDFHILKNNNDTFNAQKQIIEHQADNLKALNATKDRLFGIIAHDLRSPLSALINIIQLLDNKRISSDEFRELSGRLGQNVHGLHSMLENLLQWSLSQLEGTKPIIKPFKINDVSTETVAFFKELTIQKQVNLVLETTLEAEVLGDEAQIKTVLRNLVNNALKFTPIVGQISVNQVVKDNFVLITVTDTGVGISEKELALIFSSPTIKVGTAGEKGTGFGLSLSKELIDKNGGSIKAESSVGKGTTITIALPVYIPQN